MPQPHDHHCWYTGDSRFISWLSFSGFCHPEDMACYGSTDQKQQQCTMELLHQEHREQQHPPQIAKADRHCLARKPRPAFVVLNMLPKKAYLHNLRPQPRCAAKASRRDQHKRRSRPYRQ